VGGVLTREIRSHGEREGFRLIDVHTEESAILAGVTKIIGPRIGKYRVNLKALSELGAKALLTGAQTSDLVVCDEVGPMELLSPEFKKAIRSAILEDSKPCICVVHKRFAEPLIEEIRSSKDSKEFEVTFENRNELPDQISGEILEYLTPSEVAAN
jgi:nucleoside-triphosphatase